MYVVYWLRSRGTTYRVSTQRIRVERGILSKDNDNVELFRIDHLDVHQPFGMRLVGQCYLHLRSSDAGFPTVIIYGIVTVPQWTAGHDDGEVVDCAHESKPVGVA